MKFKSRSAQLDVQYGRRGIEKRLAAGENIRLAVVLEIEATDFNWSDDGESTEFNCVVLSAEEVKA